MKLRQFNKDNALRQLKNKHQREYNVKNRTLILSIGILILSIVYFTYARYESTSTDFTIVNATVGDFTKDVKVIAYRYDDGSGTVENHTAPPTKNSGYLASNISCQNATATWDIEEWGLDIRNITGRVSCTLEFEEAYIVQYDANGGSGEPGDQVKFKGTTLQLSSTEPTKSGYEFAGWATSSNGKVVYQAESDYTADTAVTLYARWYKAEYTAEEVVSIGNEDFLVLGNSPSSSSTVRLLTKYPIEVDSTSNNYNKQVSSGAKKVALNPQTVNGNIEISYENSGLKGYIDSYAAAVNSRDYRDLTIRSGGLMTSDDVKYIVQNSKTYGGYFRVEPMAVDNYEGWGNIMANGYFWIMPGVCPALQKTNNDNNNYWLYMDPLVGWLIDIVYPEDVPYEKNSLAPVLEIDKKDLY